MPPGTTTLKRTRPSSEKGLPNSLVLRNIVQNVSNSPNMSQPKAFQEGLDDFSKIYRWAQLKGQCPPKWDQKKPYRTPRMFMRGCCCCHEKVLLLSGSVWQSAIFFLKKHVFSKKTWTNQQLIRSSQLFKTFQRRLWVLPTGLSKEIDESLQRLRGPTSELG